MAVTGILKSYDMKIFLRKTASSRHLFTWGEARKKWAEQKKERGLVRGTIERV